MPETTALTEAMLRLPEVRMRTGLSRTSIWRKVRNGSFPPPLSLGENAIGWQENLIADWIASRPQVHYAPNPEAAAA